MKRRAEGLLGALIGLDVVVAVGVWIAVWTMMQSAWYTPWLAVLAGLTLVYVVMALADYRDWSTVSVASASTYAHWVSCWYPGWPSGLMMWFSWAWSWTFLAAVGVWLRALLLYLAIVQGALQPSGKSSCQSVIDLSDVYSWVGWFPQGGHQVWSENDEYGLCDLSLRWGGNNGQQLLGYQALGPGQPDPNAPDPDGIPGQWPEAYPNPGIGLFAAPNTISRWDNPVNTQLRWCPGVSPEYYSLDNRNVKGLGKYICTNCLAQKRRDNVPVESGKWYCASYQNPTYPASVMCNVCPSGNEPIDAASVTAALILLSVFTFWPLLRNLLLMALIECVNGGPSPPPRVLTPELPTTQRPCECCQQVPCRKEA